MKAQFTVGFSGNQEDLKQLLEPENQIESVYTGGVANMIAGGRPQYCADLNEIEKLALIANKYSVFFEIAVNAPCGIEDSINKEWWQKIKGYLKDLENIGVQGIIASHPFLMNAVKYETKLRLTASTICEIQTCRSALYYENLGADVIIPSMTCNYQLDLLMDFKKALKKAEIRLMVNEHCLGDCPWRRFHHSHYAHSSYELDYHMRCKKVYWDNPYLFLTNSVIRPEDLHRYMDITNHFKIVGRQLPAENLRDLVNAYAMEKYNGNYIDLFDKTMAKKFYIDNRRLDKLFEYKSSCACSCHTCTFCKDLYQKINEREIFDE